MSVIAIIRIIGIVCWLLHKAHHRELFQAIDENGREYKMMHCAKCGKCWEVEG